MRISKLMFSTQIGSDEFMAMEKAGLAAAQEAGFVLVAGMHRSLSNNVHAGWLCMCDSRRSSG